MAEPSISDDPTGAPKRSDVIMRSLRRRPVNDKDPHDTLAAVHDFHVSRLEWSYIPDPAFIAELHARGCLFGGAAAAPSCAGGSDAETFARLNVVDRKGAPVIAPWKRTWTPHLWGCVNNPEYERRYVEYLYTYIDASVDIMHRDEPGANYLATQWGACFCAHCMAAFRGYLATHATPTQRAELGMGDVGAFDYRDYLAAQDAPVGDAFGPWDGDALKHLFVEFQLEATVAFHERTRRAADKRAGRHIVFSCNNGVRRWTAIERSFEWTTGELNCPDANPAFILEAVQRAESLGKRQVITMPKTADREHMDPLRLLTRETIAMAYACGTQCLVPWDVFMPGNGPRYFGTPEQYADLLGFVRATATYLDDHDYVEAGGFGFDPGPETQSFLKVEGGGRLCGVARRRPGDPTAPVVVHLIVFPIVCSADGLDLVSKLGLFTCHQRLPPGPCQSLARVGVVGHRVTLDRHDIARHRLLINRRAQFPVVVLGLGASGVPLVDRLTVCRPCTGLAGHDPEPYQDRHRPLALGFAV